MSPSSKGRSVCNFWQNNTTAITIMLILLKLGLSSADLCRGGSSDWIEYDPTEKMCCAGVLHAIREDIQPYSCCGADLYNLASQRCCNGQILDPAHNRSLGCCIPHSGSNQSVQVYNSDTQICCRGTLADKAEGLACCGDIVIDTSQKTCCSNGPRDGVGKCCGQDKLYDASNEICCVTGVGQDQVSQVHAVGEDAIIDETARCCGLVTINTTEQRCCNQIPQVKAPFNDCCGQTTFDLRSQVCCEGTVSELTDGKTECCGTIPFNSNNEVCCGLSTERVYPIGHGRCCRQNPYSPVLESCCGGRRESLPDIENIQGCCGGQSYLKTDHLCCQQNKTLIRPNTDCCGRGTYDMSSEMCCDGSKLQRFSLSQRCCGKTSYEPEIETCCSRVGQSFPGSGLSCCYADWGQETKAYDPASQTCCRGRRHVGVFNEPAADERCCGKSLLQDNQLCDTARQQPINKTRPDHDAVCRPLNRRTGRPMRGGMPVTYNSEDQICTIRGDLTIRLLGEEACGQHIYNQNSELCCAGHVYNKHDQYENPQECCGNSVHVYAPSLQSCFAGSVFNVPRDVAGFCRDTVYNTDTSACDRNGLVRPRSEVEAFPSLCGTGPYLRTWTPYNPADNECCGDVLIGQGQTCCNGRVYSTPGTALGEGRCCGRNGGYNANMHICCNGRLFPTAGNRDMKCCGPRPYEPSDDTQLCCAGRLFPIEGERILCTDGIVHSLQETVCEGVRYGVANGECCGKVLMDDTKTCCQGFVYSKEEHGTECCGRVAYDPSAQPQPLCCEDSLYPSAPGLQCCGNQAIDPTERQCCGAEGHRFAFLRNSGHTCCGQTAGDYDPSQHTCCQGLLHKFVQNGDCCGNDVVRNSSKEICCGGIVQVKSFENDTVCCNGHILDGRRYQCCGNRSLQRRSTSQCCNGIVYDSRHQQCMEGEVQAKGAEETTVHARRIFARQTEHAQRITQDATDMADDDIEKTTDAEGQTAHVHERMIPRGSMEATLVTCDSMDYDSEVKGCCNGVLFRLANETCADGLVLGLCDGQDVYNPLTHGCCGDKVYNRSVDYCDETTTLVNPNTESSGQGNSTQTSTSTPGVPLCGGLGYDQALQGCCDDRVYNLSTEYCHNNSMVIPKFPSQPDRRQSTTVTTTIESATDDGFFLVTHEPCSVIRARENVSDDLQCCGSLLYNPLNATCCQGITNDGDTTVVAWSAVTEGVVAGHCCRETAYDSSTAVCCSGEVVRKEWLTPDVFNGCCPEGQSWNRFLEACEPSPTRDTILTDGPSGMSPDEY